MTRNAFDLRSLLYPIHNHYDWSNPNFLVIGGPLEAHLFYCLFSPPRNLQSKCITLGQLLWSSQNATKYQPPQILLANHSRWFGLDIVAMNQQDWFASWLHLYLLQLLSFLQVLGCGPESEASSNLSAKAEAPGYISVFLTFWLYLFKIHFWHWSWLSW